MNAATSTTITVPLDATLVADEGAQIVVTQLNIGEVIFEAASGVSLLSEGNKYTMRGRYAVASLIKLGSNTWLLSGNLVS